MSAPQFVMRFSSLTPTAVAVVPETLLRRCGTVPLPRRLLAESVPALCPAYGFAADPAYTGNAQVTPKKGTDALVTIGS
jgi:hypothetical protein